MRLPTLAMLPLVALAACLDDSQSSVDAARPDAPATPDASPPDATPADARPDATPPADAPPPPDAAPDAALPPDAGVMPAPDAATPPDAAAAPDAAPAPDAPPPPDAAPPGPHRHTITIDGVNDFTTASESFTTTSAGYSAWITWDDAYLYVAYDGPDIAGGSSTKWLLVYLDTTAGGSTLGETYNTQQPTFPASFTADYYLGWKTDNSFQHVRQFSGAAWTGAAASVLTFQAGSFVELRIPLADVGAATATQIRVATLLLDEASFAEWSYAGLYAGSFTDGYHPSIPITYYLDADFTSASPPNDPANRGP